MLQDVITRMANNSRACKTWAVTLVAAILVVVARFGPTNYEMWFGDYSVSRIAFGADAVWIALIPTILF